MKTRKLAIVDDCASDRDIIRTGAERYFKEKSIPMEIILFEDAETFLSQYQPAEYDIVILDIYMGEMTGMDVARQIRNQEDFCEILFVTTSDEFAVESYDVKATYYFLKPLKESALFKGLEICMNHFEKSEASIQVMSDRMNVKLPCSSIYFAESHRNIIEIHLRDHVIHTYMTFQNFTGMLSNEPRFLICNKGYLVNMDHIEQLDENDFVLTNQEVVPIRKRGKNQIKAAYLQYVCKKSSSF